MFGDVFISVDSASIDQLRKNYTHIAEHLLICIIHELSGAYGVSNQNLDADDTELSGSIDIALKMCQREDVVEKTLRIVALVFGLPGNIMAAIVSLSLDRTTTSLFLVALSMGDFATIVFRTSTGNTHVLVYEVLKVTIGFFPNSVLLLICFERYLAVCHPYRMKHWLTIRAAQLMVAALVLLFFFVFLSCVFLAQSKLRAPTKKLLFSGILFGLPCPFIVVFSVLTIRALRSMRKSYYMDNAKLQMWCKVESSITFMIVTSSAVFLTLNGPLFVVCLICFLVETFSDQVDVELRSRMERLISLAYWLTFLHHVANFYVYILGPKRFRIHFTLLLEKLRPSGWTRDTTKTPEISQHAKSEPVTSGLHET